MAFSEYHITGQINQVFWKPSLHAFNCLKSCTVGVDNQLALILNKSISVVHFAVDTLALAETADPARACSLNIHYVKLRRFIVQFNDSSHMCFPYATSFSSSQHHNMVYIYTRKLFTASFCRIYIPCSGGTRLRSHSKLVIPVDKRCRLSRRTCYEHAEQSEEAFVRMIRMITNGDVNARRLCFRIVDIIIIIIIEKIQSSMYLLA